MRKKAVGFTKNASSDVGEGCCDSGSVCLRSWGKARSEEASLCTREGGRTLNGGGSRARNLLR